MNMTQRFAAQPLLLIALSGALCFTVACGDDSSGGDSTSGADTDPSTGPTTAPSTGPSTTGTSESTTTDDTMGDATVAESGSTDPTGSSSSGEVVGYQSILGAYSDGFGTHTLSSETWEQEYPKTPLFTLTVEQVDDNARWVAGFGEGDPESWTEGYQRLDWDFDDDGNLRFCTAIFGAQTLEEAIAAPASDRDDLDGVGCGGMFPWSLLTEK